MRKQTYITVKISLLVVLLMTAIQGCAIGGVEVHGRVIDAATGEPVEGAYVYAESGYRTSCPFELAGCEYVVVDAALTRTNAKGYYEFDERFNFGGNPFNDKTGSVIVYKPGYITAPRMFAEVQGTGIGDVPAKIDFTASHLAIRYFYGTGIFHEDYVESPLNAGNQPYFLSSRPIQTIVPNNYYDTPPNLKPRVEYIAEVLRTSVPRDTLAGRKLTRVLLEEAKRLMVEAPDQSIFYYTCRDVYKNPEKHCAFFRKKD